MNESNRFPILIPIFAFGIAAAHLTFEHFTGGVQSHHLLHNPDMPAISNWFGLFILPVLGVVLGLRVRNHTSSRRLVGVPVPVLTALLGAFIYGAAMGASFLLGATDITTAGFIVLFICGFVLPVYRAEYILGFVTGMMFTFGSAIPLMVALVVSAVSFVVRYIVGKVAGVIRKRR